MSSRYRPQLASLVETPPKGDDWVHEIKYDGYRIGAVRDGKSVRLESRNEIDWTDKLPEIVKAVAALPCQSAVIDGEAVILLPDGRTSFQALQNVFRAGAQRGGLAYFVFDLLELDGKSLVELPLVQRKALLCELVRNAPELIRYSQHLEVDGATVLTQAAQLGMEGIVSKRRHAAHRPGRSDGWQKIKCIQMDDFWIAGFTEPAGSRKGVGALVLGTQRDGQLCFCGSVGTGKGWNAAFLTELRRALDSIRQSDCPFPEAPPAEVVRSAHWVRPVLRCEVAFAEKTQDGTLRHPTFRGFVSPDAK